MGGEAHILLRPERPDDEPFLRAVFASTREAELALLAWDPAMQAAFLDVQYRARVHSYRTSFPHSSSCVVLVDGEPAGALWTDVSAARVTLVDIAILPAFRGSGIGSSLLRGVADEADRRRLPVRLHVLPASPAFRLYERLGFVPAAERAGHLMMERAPVRAAGRDRSFSAPLHPGARIV